MRSRSLALASAVVALVAVAVPTARAAAPVRPAPASATRSLPGTPVGPGVRPHDFWLTSTQAIAIAARAPAIRRLIGGPGVHGEATVVGLGLWAVGFERGGHVVTSTRVEDRTGDVLAADQWAWTPVGSKLDPYKVRLEVMLGLLAACFLVVFFDWRHPLRIVNLDVLALLSFGASLAAYDRLHPLIAVPLTYPPMAYLFVRLSLAGWRRARQRRPPGSGLSTRALLAGMALLEVARITFGLVYPATADVGYASVLGANAIQHGVALYSPLPFFHLDTYGPANYLAYLPFELVFPMNAGWAHGSLPAAHAASLAFELGTILGLLVLGRRLRPGPDGRRLGALLAFAWVAYPFTLLPFAQNTNDGLIAALLVWALVALGSPLARGAIVGFAAAAKFTPVLLLGVMAAGPGDHRRREIPLFALAAGAIITVSVWALVPHPGGLALFWDKTIGYQLGRHSFMSLWGQHPGLGFVRSGVMALTLALAVATLLLPRRRDTTQVASLAGAILVGAEICLRSWSFYYLSWFIPFVLAGLFATTRAQPAEAHGRVRTRGTRLVLGLAGTGNRSR